METNETLTEHLQNVLQILQENRITYALAGGLAYSALVEARATMDIDLLIVLEQVSMTDIFRHLERLFDELIPHPKPMRFDSLHIWRAVGFKQEQEIILDFLLAESAFHQNVLTRATPLSFFDISLNVVTLEDLILLKKCANRPQDIVDIENIYTLYEDELDRAYLECWSKTLNLKPFEI